MKLLKFGISLFIMALVNVAFTSCSHDDDDEDIEYGDMEQNGTGGNSGDSSYDIKKTGYYEYDQSVSVLHDKQYFDEYYCTQIQFTSSSTCRVRNEGYTYKYSNGQYRKVNVNETRTCSYTKYGRKVTIKKMPLWVSGNINTSYDVEFDIVDSNRLTSDLGERYDWCNTSAKL